MTFSQPAKRALEVFVYIAILVTTIFHYGVANVLFDSIGSIEMMPKWSLYVAPILLSAGIATFVAYPYFLKAEAQK